MERRKRSRKKTRRDVYFVSSDADGNKILQDMATVLNINENGLLLESPHNLIGTRRIKIIASSGDQHSSEVDGSVVYSIRIADNKFNTGIAFDDTPEAAKSFTAAVMKK